MKIYSMTATFGKLENQTLTLHPGLNIIQAPNEWGKSTWCAFLSIMLYGLETREKTTKTSLAAKERYAPWSGAPMSGRIDLCWNGRDITIERWTKGRTPLGEFRAYETASGIAVAELTGANCGETLLGVERSVFLRAGFLRLSDLPVTEDESLRRRLNALVTTGDESGAGDLLAQKLKDLKNKCRYNRSGLIPQAESQRDELENKLSELRTLQTQSERLKIRQSELEAQIGALENHKAALRYAAAQENIQRVEQAHVAAEAAAERMAKLEDACNGMISREEAVEQLHHHAQLQQALSSLLQEANSLPPEPVPPQIPERYQDMTPEVAVRTAEADAKKSNGLEDAKKRNYLLLTLYGVAALVLLAALAVVQFVLDLYIPWLAIGICIAVPAAGVVVLTLCALKTSRIRRQLRQLYDRYGGTSPSRWVEDAVFYAETCRQYQQALKNTQAMRQKVHSRMEAVEAELLSLTGGTDAQSWMLSRNEIIAKHDALRDARNEHQQASAHADALRAMVRPAQQPTKPDPLTFSEAQTAQQLADADFEQKQLQLRLGQYQGRMDVLGTESALQNQLDAVRSRLETLNHTYRALDLALQTLTRATAELQRRFAPRIAEQAQTLFTKLTGGRYDRLTLSQDLSINAGAMNESVLRTAQWRSEGTIDQLYLALRLAVARELTPNAPLILDDALVRFDDIRHAAAMEILKEEAENKQVILFTCQSREQ